MNPNPIQSSVVTGVVIEVVLPEPKPEPELDQAIIDEAENKLKQAFETFRHNWEIERTRKNGDPLPPTLQSTFVAVISEKKNPQVKAFLAHSAGKYFLAAIATEAWAGVTNYINNNWTGVDTEMICDRVRLASDAIYKATDTYLTGGTEAIKLLNPRLRFAVQYGCLTEKDRLAIERNGKVAIEKTKPKTTSKTKTGTKAEKKAPPVEVHPVEVKKPNIDTIRGNLLSSSHFNQALWEMEQHGLSLADVISCDELQEFSEKGEKESSHTELILDKLHEPNYLTF